MSHTKFVRIFLFLIFNLVLHEEGISQLKPTLNPSSILFQDIEPFSFRVSFSKVKDAESYLVLVSEKSIPLASPTDNVTYQKGDFVYDAKVAYIGPDTSFIPKAIRLNHTYNYVVFAYNGKPGSEKYQTKNPTFNKVETHGLQIGNYYDEISSTAPNFTAQLHDLISFHKVISYYNYKTTILEDIELKDTINGKRYVECVYTGDKKVFDGPFDWTQLGFSREHTFAHSWMPTYPANNPEKTEYSDLFNLYPTNLENANTVRNNYPFGEINGKVHYEYKEGRLGERDGILVYEPSNKHKGNVARSIFYMLIAYNSNDNQWVLPTKQNEDILKKWHFQDLPDDYEKTRQEYIYHLQGNRNPFIDSVDFVCNIDFYKMIKSKKSCVVNLENVIDEYQVVVTVENQVLRVSFTENTKVLFTTLDGKCVGEFQTNEDILLPQNGMYLISVPINGIIKMIKILV
jgi:endonuclease I